MSTCSRADSLSRLISTFSYRRSDRRTLTRDFPNRTRHASVPSMPLRVESRIRFHGNFLFAPLSGPRIVISRRFHNSDHEPRPQGSVSRGFNILSAADGLECARWSGRGVERRGEETQTVYVFVFRADRSSILSPSCSREGKAGAATLSTAADSSPPRVSLFRVLPSSSCSFFFSRFHRLPPLLPRSSIVSSLSQPRTPISLLLLGAGPG